MSSAPLRRVISRALRAASRALAASTILPTMAFASAGCSSRNSSKRCATTCSTTDFTSDETSLSLVCDENFGSGSFTDNTAVRPSRASSPDMTIFLALADAFVLDVRVQRARHRGTETGQVRAAVALRDVVRVAEHAFLVAVVPLERDLDLSRRAGLGEVDDRRMNRRLVAIQVLDERFDAARELEDVVPVLALVGQPDPHAGIQKRQLSQPLSERVVVERDVREDRRARLEADRRARAVGLADHRQRALRGRRADRSARTAGRCDGS